ncbi:hypothetical protein [Luedemannella flava]|uniref:hypothetical protein n=1 Tax=Luedemannella flava TaxID=349316 RepID=UPI0031D6877E
MDWRRWTSGRAALLVVMALAGTMVLASYLSKTPCSGPPYDEWGYSRNLANSYRLVCVTDIQYLWVGRGIDLHEMPYIRGDLQPAADPPGTLINGAVEYPVLTGLFMWATALPADNSGEFLGWSAVFLLPVALAIAWQLVTLVGWRALIWAAAPAMVFYSVYNWDLLPVAWTLGAVLAWRSRRFGLSAACLGLGAATKIYPGFFLLPLFIERLVARDRRGAALVAGAGAGAWLAANGPFMAINFKGWWATYAFQAGRPVNLDGNSIYEWGFPDWTTETVDRFSVAVIAIGWLVALVAGWFVARRTGGAYPWVQVGTAMLCVFLAFNKVYSPQYFMWVLPLLALVRVRWGWWVAGWCIDAVLFIGIIRLFDDGGDSLARQAASIGSWGKSLLLMLLFFVVLGARLAVDPHPARATSPPAAPDPVGGAAPALGIA